MNETIHGIIHGRTIELTTDPGIGDGQEVEVVLRVANGSTSKLANGTTHHESAAGMMANYTDEDDAILAEIQRARKTDTRREIDE